VNDMTKKVLVLAAFAMLVSGGVFAQEKTANVKQHWLSVEAGLVGAGLRYEYMQNRYGSAGFLVYAEGVLMSQGGLSLVGRFYPWGKTFYAGLGFGVGLHYKSLDLVERETRDERGRVTSRSKSADGIVGFDIVPEIGWKIDVGKPGGFFLNPYFQVPLTLGFGSDWWGIHYRLALGMGWSFRNPKPEI
jgi:hypothetical protein